MPLKNPVTEPQVPSAIARDTEVFAAIAKTLSLFPRSGTSSIDCNNTMGDAAAGFRWLDGGNASHLNVAGGSSSGCLLQLDPLFESGLKGMYRIQFFVPGTNASNPSFLYVRHQQNGNWASWRSL
jgi:hypothetical protein